MAHDNRALKSQQATNNNNRIVKLNAGPRIFYKKRSNDRHMDVCMAMPYRFYFLLVMISITIVVAVEWFEHGKP